MTTVHIGSSGSRGHSAADALPAAAGRSPQPDRADAELEPVRAALLAAARADAAAVLAAADENAAATVAAARAQVTDLVATARREGAADAAAMLAADRARGRREARRIELSARQEAWVRLRVRARMAVTALRDDPAYARLRDRLAARARQLAGPDAVVSEPAEGGVVAVAAGRRWDLSLPALAERALDALGPEVERLWTP
jgi:vacuolar-type H+-ATPase subunit E/Vma4